MQIFVASFAVFDVKDSTVKTHSHKVSLTMNEELHRRFVSHQKTGLKKAVIIIRALEKHLPKLELPKKPSLP